MKTIKAKEIVETKPLNDDVFLIVFKGEDGLLYKSLISCDDSYCVIKEREINCSRCPHFDSFTSICKHPDAVIIESEVRYKDFPSKKKVKFPICYLGKQIKNK